MNSLLDGLNVRKMGMYVKQGRLYMGPGSFEKDPVFEESWDAAAGI